MESNYFHLAHYLLIGTTVAMPGDRLLIDDSFCSDGNAFCHLHDEKTGSLVLYIFAGILNLNGETILLLNSADPEDRESPYQDYVVVRLISATTVELVDESFVKRIVEVAKAAVALDRRENLELMKQCFGTFRDFGATEVLPWSKRD